MKCMSDGNNKKMPRTNEEYREYIKRKSRKMIIFPIVGVFLLALGLLGEFVIDVPINEHMLGFYTGAGSGLIFAGILLTIRNYYILKDEARIKKARLEMSDERIQLISKDAFNLACKITIAMMYAVAAIGGLFYPELIFILAGTVCFLLVAYCICYKVMEKKS